MKTRRALALAFVFGYLLCVAQTTALWCASMRHGTPMMRCLVDTGVVLVFPWPWTFGWLK